MMQWLHKLMPVIKLEWKKRKQPAERCIISRKECTIADMTDDEKTVLDCGFGMVKFRRCS